MESYLHQAVVYQANKETTEESRGVTVYAARQSVGRQSTFRDNGLKRSASQPIVAHIRTFSMLKIDGDALLLIHTAGNKFLLKQPEQGGLPAAPYARDDLDDGLIFLLS